MCAICQSGPALLAGVPAAGLVLARVRRALGGHRPEDDPAEKAEPETAGTPA
jgi:hypothetical protein